MGEHSERAIQFIVNDNEIPSSYTSPGSFMRSINKQKVHMRPFSMSHEVPNASRREHSLSETNRFRPSKDMGFSNYLPIISYASLGERQGRSEHIVKPTEGSRKTSI